MFIGICMYYRIWIFYFSIVAADLFNLLKKNTKWEWDDRHRKAMQKLKDALTSAPALASIDYSEPLKPIYIGADASGVGAGVLLKQKDANGKRHPVRFNSMNWTKAEAKLHAGKLEYKAILFGLKKFRR
jgi:hypothetical protein